MEQARQANPFVERVRAGSGAVGTFVFSSDPAITEIIGGAGFDLAIIDTEHATLSFADLVSHGRAAAAVGLSWWVRVGSFNPAEIGKILDTGAQGVVLPHFGLNTEQSRQMAASLRYPPRGT